MKFHDVVQYSPEYWELRRAVPTASRFDKIITPTTCKPSGQQDSLIAELLAEQVQNTAPFFSNRGSNKPVTPEMQEGMDREAESRRWYEFQYNVDVTNGGFCVSDCGRYGCSPDGLIGADGVLELKNPKSETHIGYLMKGGLPADYRPQVHGHLIVTGRAYVHFVSYCPPLPDLAVRVEPDEFTEKLRAELERFIQKYHQAALKLGVMLATAEGEVLEPVFKEAE